jgi:hypothetical protein
MEHSMMRQAGLAVLLGLSLRNVFSFAYPGWFVLVVLVALGAGGWLGMAWARRRSA